MGFDPAENEPPNFWKFLEISGNFWKLRNWSPAKTTSKLGSPGPRARHPRRRRRGADRRSPEPLRGVRRCHGPRHSWEHPLTLKASRQPRTSSRKFLRNGGQTGRVVGHPFSGFLNLFPIAFSRFFRFQQASRFLSFSSSLSRSSASFQRTGFAIEGGIRAAFSIQCRDTFEFLRKKK